MTKNTDASLLNLLRANARAPVSELARSLGVSRSTVQSRIERLEQQGIITGYSIKVSDSYAQSLVRAHVLVTALPKLSHQVVQALEKIEEVKTLHSVSGQFDMIVVVEALSISDLDALLDRIGALDGVERTMSSIILSTRIDR
ncbi:Lrp/AsnC family transcriptional regulator [Pseudomonas sp. 8Z]|uniref:Lrp/AsnC family transcriptional regulator n=1 Tax=Pseudomonas sp. 8Z TaxID=2653166 RepID=UPI00135A65DA|nr:Lrp/AsnC family transcriptional regulator [Pseudomonas sp. 8Z]